MKVENILKDLLILDHESFQIKPFILLTSSKMKNQLIIKYSSTLALNLLNFKSWTDIYLKSWQEIYFWNAKNFYSNTMKLKKPLQRNFSLQPAQHLIILLVFWKWNLLYFSFNSICFEKSLWFLIILIKLVMLYNTLLNF